MRKLLMLFALAASCISCGGMQVRQSRLAGIDPTLDATFSNLPEDQSTQTLLRILGTEAKGLDKVRLTFDREGDFRIEYKNVLGGTEFRAFKRKFKKSYYEIFLAKDRINIPLVYSRANVERIRISLDKKGAFVVDQYFDHSGSIFIFAGGGHARYLYYFQSSKNPG